MFGKDVTFPLAFLVLYAAARAMDNKNEVVDDLDQAEEDARAFMDRLKELKDG